MTQRLNGLQRKNLASNLIAAIDAYSVTALGEDWRDHLGASEIGHKCRRKLLYGFRWFRKATHPGNVKRLFDRGHKEESRFVQWLRGAGCEVWEVDENGKQFRINSPDGHFGGSLDGVTKLIDVADAFLLEMKTYNDKTFKKLQKDGVRVSKPLHFDQMCVYGEDKNLPYAVYIAVNKNDDEIHVEIVELDFDHARKLREKATGIITAPALPNRIAATAAHADCKYCDMKGICHSDEKPEINCRSCQHSSAVQGGEWYCDHWKSIIPKDAIPKACNQWSVFT